MKLAILDPGHFHAALVQKKMYTGIDETVHIYAPKGPDLDDYLRRIEGYNTRAQDPTHWRAQLHTGADFLERFAAEQTRGTWSSSPATTGARRNISGARSRRDCHTLADKPMAIDAAGFVALGKAFAVAQAKNVLLYDIMTERHEITTMLQKEFSTIADGVRRTGHGLGRRSRGHQGKRAPFAKLVSGLPLKRPAWFFDTAQQGEGLVDITTHLVDLVQWECFPDQIIEYRTGHSGSERPALADRRSAPRNSQAVTQLQDFPAWLRRMCGPDGNLHTYANGEINYTIRGVHAKVSVLWNFEAPAGAGDTHYSIMRGCARESDHPAGQARRLSTRPHHRAARDHRTRRRLRSRWSTRCRRCRHISRASV